MVDKYVGIITEDSVGLTNILKEQEVAHACVYNNKEKDGESIYFTFSKIPKKLRERLESFKSPEKIVLLYMEEPIKPLEQSLSKRPSYLETEDLGELDHFIQDVRIDTERTDFSINNFVQLLTEFTSTRESNDALKNGTFEQYLEGRFNEYIKNAKLQDRSGI